MKNIYLIFVVLIIFSVSCKKNFEDFNTDKKHPTKVPGETIFTNAQKELADQEASTNVNLNVWKLFAQHWTETTYIDEAGYDIVNRTIPDNVFRAYYRSILSNLNEASKVIANATAAVDEAPEVKSNKLHIITILNVFVYQKLVDIFGNVPYSEALDINNTSPKYDDGLTIYKDLIARLDVAIAGLDVSEGSFGAADLYYGGDVSGWLRFANSLKIKLGITLSDVEPALAKATVEAAVAGAFTSESQMAKMNYLTSTPNTNPLYVDLVASGRKDFVPANTIVDLMNSLNDPRRPFYFTLAPDSTYKGGQYGYSNSFSKYSHIGSAIQVPDFPCVLMDYVEVEFYLAEAAARGYAVGGTEESHYNNAITQSILFWGGTSTDAITYLAQSSVAYTTASGDYKRKIGTQAWLALYTRGLEAYTEWRRMDAPSFNIAKSITDSTEIPKRFTYPINEQTLNGANYSQAAAAIGGDKLTTKIFWDVK